MTTKDDVEVDADEINVDDEKWKLKPNYGRPGKKVFAVALHERGQTSTGKDQILCHCVVLKDAVKPNPELDPPTDVGMTFRCKLYPGSVGGMRRLITLVRAHGWKGTVNVKSDDGLIANSLVKVWGHGYFAAEVTSEEGRDGKVWFEIDPDTAVPYTGEVDPEWPSQVDAAGDRVQEAITKRDEAKAKAAESGGGRGGGRGAGSRKSGGDSDKEFGF